MTLCAAVHAGPVRMFLETSNKTKVILGSAPFCIYMNEEC